MSQIIIRILVCLSCFVAVVFLVLPNRFKSRFMRDNEQKIIKMLGGIVFVTWMFYIFLG